MSGRIAVLHLITKLPYGGAQENTLLTVRGLDRRVYRVDVASSPGGEWQAWAAEVSDQLHLLPAMRREMSPRHDALTIWHIYRLLRQQRYAIVHTHSSKAGFLGRIAARLARTPVVVHTVHGFAFNDRTFSPRKQAVYLWMERIGARLCDHLIMVAALNQQEALARGIGSADKMSVIYSGLELSRFQNLPPRAVARQQLGLPVDAPVIGFVGRFTAATAPQLFVRAAQSLLARYPHLYAIMAGDGELRPQVEQLAGQEPRLQRLGYRLDIPLILAACNVFVSSNLWGGLGRAITEAAAAGLPVVAFPVNGVPELISDGVAGFHARIGDADDLAAKTAILLDQPEMAARLGAHGQQRAWAHFSVDNMVADIDSLYRRLLRRRGIPVAPVSPAASPPADRAQPAWDVADVA